MAAKALYNDCLQCAIPELKELALSWGKINDYSKGKKIGYIIGKYGVDIFAPVGVLKGVNKVRALKRANTMFTLESCVVSQANKAKILEESVKRASLRETLIAESVTKGQILTKNANVQYHVMQKKHAWDKVIKLSGNVEEDFQSVVTLLEKNKIQSKSFMKDNPILFPKNGPRISKSEYEKVRNNWKVHAEFETFLETDELFLKDAWVVTK